MHTKEQVLHYYPNAVFFPDDPAPIDLRVVWGKDSEGVVVGQVPSREPMFAGWWHVRRDNLYLDWRSNSYLLPYTSETGPRDERDKPLCVLVYPPEARRKT